MIPLLGLLFILRGTPSLCLEEDGSFVFDGDFRHFAVANNTIYIATEEKLYQLNRDLTPVHSQTQRGVLKPSSKPDHLPGTKYFHRAPGAAGWNTTFRVNILLPFPENKSVIACGVLDNDCGYCEILDQKDISTILHKENFQVGPRRSSSSASVSFLVTLKNQLGGDTYILTAIEQSGPEDRCSSDSKAVQLHNTDDNPNRGGVFSLSGESQTPTIKSKVSVEFVDGFQISSFIYLLFNVPSAAKNNRVRLVRLEDKSKKKETLETLSGVTLSVSDGGAHSRLLASSLIPGGLWSGVFSVDGGATDTELLVFDISLHVSGEPDNDPHLYFHKEKSAGVPEVWLPRALLLRQSNMTSVLAVKQKAWMVFFIGTGDGQLIKLAVDRNYHSACPRVLYKSNKDRRVFPRMQLDQVDHKHLYVPFQDEMKRVAVAKCHTHTNVQECWSAHDPYCVWCVARKSCTFEADCEDSDWLAIPDDFQQNMISHKVARDATGQLTLNVTVHVKASREMRLACQISTTSGELCKSDGVPPKFPQCTCILSKDTFPPEGLRVIVKMKLDSTNLNEQLQLMNCPNISGSPTPVLCQRCIKAGCGWINNGCSWANEGVLNDSVCQTLQPELNFTKPKISSILPSAVSFYGRNHAVLSGHNLGAVIGVRLQADLDCTPQESPVWNNTGVSLTFHIPTTNKKGTAKVCALLPDGSCHGDASITYRSSPSCSGISPQSSWMSGGRRITLVGSHMQFVEGVVHGHAPREVRLPANINDQQLTYATPAATNTPGVSSSSVLLKVANETLRCHVTMTYHPDPEFSGFTSTQVGDKVYVTIKKKADKLQMTAAELSVWGDHGGVRSPCIMEDTLPSGKTDLLTCEIEISSADVDTLTIKYGVKTVWLAQPALMPPAIMILRFVFIALTTSAIIFICLWQKKLTERNNL